MLDPAHPGASRLNHLGTFYAGAIAELGRGHPITLLQDGVPGLDLVRDLVQLVLFQRAELNALTKALSEAGHLDPKAFGQQCEDDYEWLANAKADHIGQVLGLDIKITDRGVDIARRTP